MMTTDATGLAGTGGIAARDALVTALGAAGIAVAAGVTPTAFAAAAGTYLTAAPMLATHERRDDPVLRRRLPAAEGGGLPGRTSSTT